MLHVRWASSMGQQHLEEEKHSQGDSDRRLGEGWAGELVGRNRQEAGPGPVPVGCAFLRLPSKASSNGPNQRTHDNPLDNMPTAGTP